MKGRFELQKPSIPPAFLKNKNFVKWTKTELAKREDQIVSTDWHEKLQKTVPFTPAYGNAPLNMVYLLSGEYGRIWLKERDEWYSKVFTLPSKLKDIEERKKKIRKKIRDAKKAAEKSIRERRERLAREEEMKMKLEREKEEKLKAKVQKDTNKTKKATKKQGEREQPSAAAGEIKPEKSPKGPPSEPTKSQCECSMHDEAETDKQEKKTEEEMVNASKTEPDEYGTTICEAFCKEISNMQENDEIGA